MSGNFSKLVVYNGKNILATIIPELRKDGMYYEVNIKGVPRFFMTWSPLDRYDVAVGAGVKIPYELVLAVSDTIEQEIKNQK